MEFLGLTAGLTLPWLLGIVWLRTRWLKAENIPWPTLFGYGYLAGALATTLVMRILDMLGFRLGFGSVGLCLLALIALGIWLGPRGSRGIVLSWRDIGADWRELNGLYKVAYAALLALIAVRLAGLGLEIIWRPLFPWDAWSQWATKARVWYEVGHLVPFVSGDIWLATPLSGAYTDAAPHYPPAIPLLQVWTSYSLGRWDDARMNLPWLQCALALSLAFYGQARHWQVPPLFAMMFTYFLLSLPILDSHVALAGYADLFMGTFLGLAAMAFFHWSRTREHWQAAMAALFSVGCAFIKQPGIVWMMTFLPALYVVIAPRSWKIGSILLATAAVLSLFVLSEMESVSLFGFMVPQLRYKAVWEPLLQNFLLLDNWHLFWYLLLGAVALSLPRLLSDALRGMTVLVLTGILFLAIVFFFTQAQIWAEDYTTLNRAFLHIAPMLLFYMMVLFRDAVRLPAFFTSRLAK